MLWEADDVSGEDGGDDGLGCNSAIIYHPGIFD